MVPAPDVARGGAVTFGVAVTFGCEPLPSRVCAVTVAAQQSTYIAERIFISKYSLEKNLLPEKIYR